MQIAKKIRLYPNKEQEELFCQFAGTSKLFDFSKNFCYNIYRKLRKEKLKMNKRFSNSKDSDVDFREGC